MGEKGSKQSEAASAAAAEIVDDLAVLGDVRSKKRFGGFGVFCEDTMFAIVDPSGRVFMRADDTIATELEEGGGERHGRMPYWSVGDSIRGDHDRRGRLGRPAG